MLGIQKLSIFPRCSNNWIVRIIRVITVAPKKAIEKCESTRQATISAQQGYPHHTLQCLVYSAMCGEDMVAAQENTSLSS